MKRRLGIAEMAELYNVSARTLRYYEEAGILTSHRRAGSIYREYDNSQRQRLEVILLLRRLSFSVKSITDMLRGDDDGFREALQGRIAESGTRLIEARETDRMLRDLAAELSCKPATELKVAEMLRNYTYLTQKTERMIPMNSPQSEKYRVAIGMPIAAEVCNENAGGLLDKIGALRSALEKESTLPRIRIYDNADLPPNQVLVVWDGKEVWRKDFGQFDAAVCADEIVEQIKMNCLKM